jgi:NTP pyrophosphatase (non-canonical NTP hydrolase)
MTKTLAEMTAEIRANNIEKGWRLAEGGPGTNTFGDYLALLHSEVSEALEAYRDHRLADATEPEPDVDAHHDGRMHGICVHAEPRGACPWVRVYPKPEGVGSELADVLIRLLDMADVFGVQPFDMDCELADVAPLDRPDFAASFGDHVSWLHFRIADIDPVPSGRRFDGGSMSFTLRALVAVAELYGIDLDAEYQRKMAYNRTRPYQHGGRTLAASDQAEVSSRGNS